MVLGNIVLQALHSYQLVFNGVSEANGGAIQSTLFLAAALAVPEPEEWAMLLLGLPLIGCVVRRKQAKAAA